jgi:lipopolysaccharide/colanic/teichoic acid biosynthesis glycosyltransferase
VYRLSVLSSVRVTKRAIDIVSSVVGLAVTAPLFPILAGAIYIDSPGPIFYKQTRAGKLRGTDGTGRYLFDEFRMWKFRTMRTDAEKVSGAVLASEGDPRVTRIGKVLRKSRLDELPQLLNVLGGSMSLVGPRPERPELLNNLALAIPMFEERMRDVKPGITGLAQISLGYAGKPLPGSDAAAYEAALVNPFKLDEAEGATADEMRMKLLYDMAYVASLEKFTTFLATELGVIAKTPLVMLKGIGR